MRDGKNSVADPYGPEGRVGQQEAKLEGADILKHGTS